MATNRDEGTLKKVGEDVKEAAGKTAEALTGSVPDSPGEIGQTDLAKGTPPGGKIRRPTPGTTGEGAKEPKA